MVATLVAVVAFGGGLHPDELRNADAVAVVKVLRATELPEDRVVWTGDAPVRDRLQRVEIEVLWTSSSGPSGRVAIAWPKPKALPTLAVVALQKCGPNGFYNRLSDLQWATEIEGQSFPEKANWYATGDEWAVAFTPNSGFLSLDPRDEDRPNDPISFLFSSMKRERRAAKAGLLTLGRLGMESLSKIGATQGRIESELAALLGHHADDEELHVNAAVLRRHLGLPVDVRALQVAILEWRGPLWLGVPLLDLEAAEAFASSRDRRLLMSGINQLFFLGERRNALGHAVAAVGIDRVFDDELLDFLATALGREDLRATGAATRSGRHTDVPRRMSEALRLAREEFSRLGGQGQA